MPMLSTPGYESANLYVLLLGPLLALAAAINARTLTFSVRNLLKRELLWFIIHVAIIFVLLYAQSLRVTSCSQGAGVGTFLIILGPALFLNSMFGSLLAAVFYKLRDKLVILISAFLIFYAYKLHVWWHDSPFRFISDLSLILTSDLAQGGEITPALISFRLGTLCFALALMFLILALWPKKMGKKNYSYFIFAFFFIGAALLLHGQSLKAIGKNNVDLAKDYNLSVTKDNITLHAHPDFTSIKQAHAILEEALFYQEIIKKRIGATSNLPITIWLHRNDDDKNLYTGAKNVHFAQPTQRTIHISGIEIPHSVLGHELAHIYVGEFSTTLWGLPGRFWILPNMALTEGLAMVLTPELAITNNLDLMQQAQALQQAGMGLDISQLFSLNPINFSRSDFRASYIFAGAFLTYYLEHFSHLPKTEALQFIARSGSLPALFSSKEELYKALAMFSSFLANPVDGYALVWAQRNFGTLGILVSDCSGLENNSHELFWRLILNQDSSAAIASLASFSRDQQISLALRASKSCLEQDQLNEAFALITHASNLARETNDLRLAEIYLQEYNISIRLQKYSEARLILSKIDPLLLNHSDRRQLIISTELLGERNTSIDANYSQLLTASENILSAGFAEKYKLLFMYALGKNYNKDTLATKLGFYIYARLLSRANDYANALIIISSILAKPEYIPASILQEILFMKTHALLELKRYAEARETALLLLARPLSESDDLIYTNLLERIDFYMRQN
jgi:hypothetical protein